MQFLAGFGSDWGGRFQTALLSATGPDTGRPWAGGIGFQHPLVVLLLGMLCVLLLALLVRFAARQSRLREEYERLFETSWDGVLRLDAEGRIGIVNRAAALLIGEPRESLRGLLLSNWVLARSRGAYNTALQGALHSSEVLRAEIEFSGGDGSVRLVDVSFRRITDTNQVECVLRDVTDRRRKALNDSLNRLSEGLGAADSSVANFAAALVAEVVPAMKISQASVWMADATGRGIRLLAGFPKESFRELEEAVILEADAPNYFAAIREERVLAVDGTFDDARTAELAESYFKPMDVRSLLDGGMIVGGQLIGVICLETAGFQRAWTAEEQVFARALSNLMLAAIAHEERDMIRGDRSRMAAIVETTTDLVVVSDTAGLVVFMNPAARALFGGNGRMAFLTDILPKPFREGALRDWIEQGGTPATWSGDLVLRGANGVERAVSLVVVAHRSATGAVELLSFVMRDVTQRLAAEAALREANETLEQRVAERTRELAAANDQLKELDRLKSEFLATMSHELRTPLNSIIGFTGILKGGMAGPLTPEQKKQLEMVHGSAKHLLGLINDLLDLSRIESGRMDLDLEPVSPADVAAEVEKMLLPMVRQKDLAYETRIVGDAMLRSDRKKLFQVLLNLANNAVKFTDRGSVVVRGGREGSRYVFSVTDTGPGIRPENIGKLFEAFRQVDGSARRVYEGTGLGLYLCRKLVGLLGGEIGVASEAGSGSCFSFWIPATEAPSGPAKP